MKIGLRVKIQDPEDPTQIVNAQFATVRSNPQLGEMLRGIAKLDVAQSVAVHRLEKVARNLDDPEKEVDAEAIEKARLEADEATNRTLEATHAFIVEGFKLAGASAERAEELASLIDIERAVELKARCVYGAGCMDFTKAAGQ